MKVLHVIVGLADGGAEAVLYRACICNPSVEHLVISLTGRGKYGPLLEARHIPVVTLDMPRGRLTLAGLWRLWRVLRTSRPDVVQTWMYHADFLGGVFARLAGHGNVIWGIHHGELGPAGMRLRTLVIAKLCAWLSRIVPRRIVCCASAAAKAHVAFGYDGGRMTVIPNGCDLAIYRPDPGLRAAVRRELGIGPSDPVIGFVARFDVLKDHDNLLRALALAKARGAAPICLLAGEGMGPDNAKLRPRIAELGLGGQVILLGQRDDVAGLMNAIDVHVLSSSSEAAPNVLTEAMACGTPCVSTQTGDVAGIVGDTGWLVPPRNSQALAGAIVVALAARDAPCWEERRRAARRRVRSLFSVEQMADRYLAVWREPA